MKQTMPEYVHKLSILVNGSEETSKSWTSTRSQKMYKERWFSVIVKDYKDVVSVEHREPEQEQEKVLKLTL